MPGEVYLNIKDIVDKLLPEALKQGLEAVGQLIEDEAKENCPHDDGQLKASITHQVSDGLDEVVIGSNLEYAPYVHQGTGLYAAEGDGPVNALDKALRKALEVFYPNIRDVRLTDFKVRVIDSKSATASKVRVLIESSDGQDIWSNVGVSTDIIEASLIALIDSIEYKLLNDMERQSNSK